MRRTPVNSGILICLTLFAAAGATFARDRYPILVYPVPKVESPPRLDGVLDDACWKDAPLVGGFTIYNQMDVLAEVQTSLKVVHNDKYLYLGVICEEPNMSNVMVTGGARDSDVFSQEAIEIFIDPYHDHSEYYQLGGSISGALYDAQGFNPVFDTATTFTVNIGKDTWTTEWAIPLVDFKLKMVQSGHVLGFNICRDRYVTGKTEWMNWSQSPGGFHQPVYFAHLVLSPTAEQLGKLGDEFRKGEREGPIRIFSAEGFSQTAYLTLVSRQLSKLQNLLQDLETMGTRETEQARAELNKRLQGIRQEIRPYQDQLQSSSSIDAATFTKMEMRFNEMRGALATLLWDARLAAILAELQ